LTNVVLASLLRAPGSSGTEWPQLAIVAFEGIAEAKARGVYKGRIKQMKAGGLGSSPRRSRSAEHRFIERSPSNWLCENRQ
jgi:hypothetical protein